MKMHEGTPHVEFAVIGLSTIDGSTDEWLELNVLQTLEEAEQDKLRWEKVNSKLYSTVKIVRVRKDWVPTNLTEFVLTLEQWSIKHEIPIVTSPMINKSYVTLDSMLKQSDRPLHVILYDLFHLKDYYVSKFTDNNFYWLEKN